MSGIMNAVKEYIKERLPLVDGGSIDVDHGDDVEETREDRFMREEEERERLYREQEEERFRQYELSAQGANQQPANPQPTYQQPAYQQPAYQQLVYRQPTYPPGQLSQKSRAGKLVTKLKGQVENDNFGGVGYLLCDMERMKRFIILGSEFNTYYCSAKKILIDNVKCVSRLIENNHYQAVLDTIEQYAKEGRAFKDEPLLTVLAICALSERSEVKRAAYEKINSICNIPTKLFKFVDMTHDEIVRQRIANPPLPQPYASKKRKLDDTEVGISELTISEEKREPSENVDETRAPPKKKKKNEKEFKKVSVVAAKSLGWGRLRRTGVARFYADSQKDPCRLLYLLTKYKQRHNWDHKQVLQYSHPKMSGEDKEAKDLVLKYCTRGYEKIAVEMKELATKAGLSEKMSEVIAYIEAVDAVKNLKPDTEGDEEKLIQYLEKYGRRSQDKEFTTQLSLEGSTTKENQHGRKSSIQIVREHIPTGFLNSRKVWELMLLDMPMTAMIRNLGKMSSLGMFEDSPQNTKIVLSALDNAKRLQSARVHPVKLLIAAETYQRGKGEKGSLKWDINQDILTSLNTAFYKSFKSPELGKSFRTGLKYLLALDVSGSMQGSGCLGCDTLTPAKATAAMAMVTWHIEDDVEIMGFGGELVDLKPRLNKEMLVQDAMNTIGKLNFGATDCSLPMIFALMEKKEIDVFIVYTDCETDYSTWQPMDALRAYNKEMNKDAKLIVMGMTSAGFTIADPESPNALDICGFDANVPELINNFIAGNKDMKCDVCVDCKKIKEEIKEKQ